MWKEWIFVLSRFIFFVYIKSREIEIGVKMMNILEIKNLMKKFGNFIVVDNMFLFIKEGEIFGFLGLNGVGKSIMINMIVGLLRSNEGEISILGKNIKKYNWFVKMNIGIVL